VRLRITLAPHQRALVCPVPNDTRILHRRWKTRARAHAARMHVNGALAATVLLERCARVVGTVRNKNRSLPKPRGPHRMTVVIPIRTYASRPLGESNNFDAFVFIFLNSSSHLNNLITSCRITATIYIRNINILYPFIRAERVSVFDMR